MESQERKDRAKRLVGYGIFFEISNLMNENEKLLIGYLLNLSNIDEENLKFYHSIGFDETIKRNKKGFKERIKNKYEKNRNYHLIKKGALLETVGFFIKDNLLKYDNEILLGYLLEYGKLSNREKMVLYNLGKEFLEQKSKLKEK